MIDTLQLFTEEFKLREGHKFEHKGEMDFTTGEITKEKKYFNSELVQMGIKQNDKERLFIKMSLPKLIHGTSLREITEGDLDKVKDVIRAELSSAGIDFDSDLDKWRPSRIDFCKNMIVDKPLPLYFTLLSTLQYPRTKTSGYSNETCLWMNKGRELTFYDKLAETPETERGLITIEGNLLRYENRLKNNRVIVNTFDKHIGLSEFFNKELVKKQLLSEYDKLVKVSINNERSEKDQMAFDFYEHDKKLLADLKAKNKRLNRFFEIRGTLQFLVDYAFDFNRMELLFKDFVGERQRKRIKAELKECMKDFGIHSEVFKQRSEILAELRERISA